MTDHSQQGPDGSPILLVPYQWIGDFVRCHSVVRILRARYPGRPVDVLTTPLCAPLLDCMPGIRKGVIAEIPRRTLPLGRIRELAKRLRAERYGTALVMPRTWKAALAPFLAGIPERVGFVGEARFGLINDLRFGERTFVRMIDQCASLALPREAAPPVEWPLPQLAVPAEAVTAWRATKELPDDGRPVVALCPGAVGPSKRWHTQSYAELARDLTARDCAVWVLGGPAETALAGDIIRDAGPLARDLTSNDLRNAVLALGAAQAAVSNDSGLLHVAAAIGTPSVGIFGPTSPWHWAPLNPIAAVIEAPTALPCRPCHKPTCRLVHHRCMGDISSAQVLAAVERAMAGLHRSPAAATSSG